MGIRAQAATEYLMVIGFVVVLLLPGIYLYIQYSGESKDSITNAKVDAITNELVKAAEQVHSYGEGSQTSITVDLPENVVAITFQGNEIVFTVINSKGKQSEIVKVANVNLEGEVTLIQGTKKINIKSLGNSVTLFIECTQGLNRCGSDIECDYYIDNYQEGNGCSLTCNENKWELDEECFNGCEEEGMCIACQDGQLGCGGGASCGVYESCVTICQDSNWEYYYGCDSPMCFEGKCGCNNPGDRRCGNLIECEGDDECIMNCDSTLVWSRLQGCFEPLSSCSDGECVAPCMNGETRCGTEQECTLENPFECIMLCANQEWIPNYSCTLMEPQNPACEEVGGLATCVPGGGGAV
tara:strand:- start:5993 stop:7054 length:1062 start_codon:yes stop_codon:yes gene_type:complete